MTKWLLCKTTSDCHVASYHTVAVFHFDSVTKDTQQGDCTLFREISRAARVRVQRGVERGKHNRWLLLAVFMSPASFDWEASFRPDINVGGGMRGMRTMLDELHEVSTRSTSASTKAQWLCMPPPTTFERFDGALVINMVMSAVSGSCLVSGTLFFRCIDICLYRSGG